jgi:hypothetical protein
VENEIGQMMRACIETEELNIKYVGEPGQWVPVGGMAGLKRPQNTFEGEALVDHRIGGHVIRIVQVHEFEARDRPVDC